MAISNAELGQIWGMMGVGGRVPLTGGPTGFSTPFIAQSIPIEDSNGNSVAASTGVMKMTAMFIPGGVTIRNINFLCTFSGETGGSHLWYALYDDGRSSTTAGQLALLGQTADQTGATFMGTNSNVGLSLVTPWTTTYSGLYYVAFMCVATGMPILVGSNGPTNPGVQINPNVSNASWGCTAGSGLTNQAPNPSGTVTRAQSCLYTYVS